LQPVLGDYSFDAPRADRGSALPQLLRDHLGGGVGVEEAVSDHLPDHLGCSPIVGFGTALLALQSEGARLLKGSAELKVTLLAVAELAGGLERPHCSTLPFDKHQQLAGDLVVLGDVQATVRTNHHMFFHIVLGHPCFLP